MVVHAGPHCHRTPTALALLHSKPARYVHLLLHGGDCAVKLVHIIGRSCNRREGSSASPVPQPMVMVARGGGVLMMVREAGLAVVMAVLAGALGLQMTGRMPRTVVVLPGVDGAGVYSVNAVARSPAAGSTWSL
jgi:hypothetical protein